jgi:hypothetical protein
MDLLDRTRQEIANRLKQLKPQVEEYRQLEVAAKALGGVRSRGASAATSNGRRKRGRPRGSVTASAKAPGTRATATSKGRGGRRKGTGTRAAQALAAVQAQPGITIPELAAKMGIKQNYLYRVMPELEKEKKVAKRDRGWHAAP